MVWGICSFLFSLLLSICGFGFPFLLVHVDLSKGSDKYFRFDWMRWQIFRRLIWLNAQSHINEWCVIYFSLTYNAHTHPGTRSWDAGTDWNKYIYKSSKQPTERLAWTNSSAKTNKTLMVLRFCFCQQTKITVAHSKHCALADKASHNARTHTDNTEKETTTSEIISVENQRTRIKCNKFTF